jgi:predicted nucleic acid-binding protein
MSLVLDASVALSWLLPDEHHARSLTIRKLVLDDGATATMFWRYEVANGLLMAARRKRYDVQRIAADLRTLALLPVSMDEATWACAWAQSITIAQTHKLTAYDAAYLELALRSNLPLATFDAALAKAARAAGAKLVSP